MLDKINHTTNKSGENGVCTISKIETKICCEKILMNDQLQESRTKTIRKHSHYYTDSNTIKTYMNYKNDICQMDLLLLIRTGNDLSQQSADFETAISHTGYGKFNYFLLLIAFPATCSNTFDTTSMSFALPSAACELQLTDFDKGCLNAVIFAGMISSAFLWGFLSDTFGRQRLLTIGYTIDAIFGIMSGTSQTFCTILIFKFLSGVAICGPYSIFVAYLSELFNGKYRDSVIMSTGIFTSIGGVIQPILAWYVIPKKMHYEFFDGAIRVNSWRIFILISTLPSIMAAILTAFCVESPKFLMSQGRREEALRVFRTIYAINTGRPAHTYPIKKLRDERRESMTAPQNERRQSSNKTLLVVGSFWQQVTALFKKPHLHNALHVFSVQFAALLSMNTVRLWMPELFFKIEQIPNVTSKIVCEIVLSNITRKVTNCDEITVDPQVYIKLVYVAFITTICFMGGSYLISIIGKEQFLLSSFAIAAISGWVFSWCTPSWAVHCCAIYVSALQANTVAILGVVVQLFPTHLRTMAVSMTMMFGRLGVLLGSLAFPFVLSISCWAPFMAVGTITCCCAIAVIPLLPSWRRDNSTTQQANTSI